MANGGADSPAPPSENGGEFLLSLLHRRPLTRPSPSQGPDHHQQSYSLDPAIAAVGPTVNSFPPPPSNNNGRDRLGTHTLLPPWQLAFSPPNRNPNLLGFSQFPVNSFPGNQFDQRVSPEDAYRLGFSGIGNQNHTIQPPPPPPTQQSEKQQQHPKLLFGSFSGEPSQSLLNGKHHNRNPSDPNLLLSHNRNQELRGGGGFSGGGNWGPIGNNNNGRSLKSTLPPPPPGFSSNQRGWDNRDSGSEFQRNHEQSNLWNVNDRLRSLSIHNEGRFNHHGAPPPMAVDPEDTFLMLNKEARGLVEYNNEGRLNHRGSPPIDPEDTFLLLKKEARGGVEYNNEGRFNLHGSPPIDPEDTFLMLNKEARGGVNEGRFNHRGSPPIDPEDTFLMLNKEARGGVESRQFSKGKKEGNNNGEFDEIEDFGEDIVESLLLDDETEDKDAKDGKKNDRVSREKEPRNDNRGQWLLGQKLRMVKRYMACRNDIHRLDAPFIGVYKSLIPTEEELEKQRQLMAKLENLVAKEWPRAKLYLYGSCANSFGFPKSDIDVCLAIEDDDVNKSEMLLKLADILESDNFQNVQAFTRARVPIVKLMDPVTGISCDICINNVLAVVNTKLLRDYACIDVRLRQLAFIVKHWAKSRKVNETYQGTLSSYAYVIMCIHFLQQRRPPILPCLQEMDPTYSVRVDNIRCSFFDKVERLGNFGSSNRETIAELVWGFFNYWAYAHDYAHDVISVRTGSVIGKREKDWTRRVGNDRHLICIEDPFETSHDLGRVVDKFSIRVLREEFERAAKIMHHDHNPCAKLFEPYLPPLLGDNHNNGQQQQGGGGGGGHN